MEDDEDESRYLREDTANPSKPYLWRHGCNVLKSWIGSNYLSIPFCFAAAGFLVGPLSLVLVALIAGYGCLLLVKVRRRLEDKKHVVDTYGQVAGAVYGRWGHGVVECFLFMTQFGYCVGYTLYNAKAITQLSNYYLTHTQVVLLLSPVSLALCCIKDLKRFAPFSVVSNLALLVAFVVIMGMATSHMTHHDAPQGGYPSLLQVDLSKLPLSFGNVVASYEGIGTVLPVEGAMARDGDAVRKHYPWLLQLTLTIITILFSIFGMIGYATYGSSLCSVILSNLPPSGLLPDTVRISITVGLLITYPFQMYPVLEVVDILLLGRKGALLGNDESGSDADQYGSLALMDDDDAAMDNHQDDDHLGNGLGVGGDLPCLLADNDDGNDDNTSDRASNSSVCSKKGGGRATEMALAKSSCSRRYRLLMYSPWRIKQFVFFYGARVVLVGLASTIAIFVPEFELLMSLVGSLGASFLAFVAPGVLAFAVLRPPGHYPPSCWLYLLLVVFGAVGGGLGTAASLTDLVEKKSQC